MAYSDILNATQLYGRLLNNKYANTANNINQSKLEYTPVNPYSSSAFATQSSRSLYPGTGRGLLTGMQLQEENQLEGMDKTLTKVGQGLQFANFGNKVTPFLNQALGSLGVSGNVGSLGPAAALFGATRDNNPYDYSQTEALGTLGSSVLAARSFSNVLNPILGKVMPLASASAIPAGIAAPSLAAGVAGPLAAPAAAGVKTIFGMHPLLLVGSLLLGGLFNKKARKNARKQVEKEIQRVAGEQTKISQDRAEAVEEQREEMLARQAANMYEDTQAMYTNQYGGNYRGGYNMEKGGKMDVVAEFTGNELIVNDQDQLESDIARGDNKSAANRIRKAMKGGKITPGKETHKSNPIPVASDGTMYTKGGPMNFKVKKGAGVYDHATDQFKMDMDDDSIVSVVKKNMAKWRKNNMA